MIDSPKIWKQSLCKKKSPEGLTKISVGKILGKSRKTRKNENLMKLDEI